MRIYALERFYRNRDEMEIQYVPVYAQKAIQDFACMFPKKFRSQRFNQRTFGHLSIYSLSI